MSLIHPSLSSLALLRCFRLRVEGLGFRVWDDETLNLEICVYTHTHTQTHKHTNTHRITHTESHTGITHIILALIKAQFIWKQRGGGGRGARGQGVVGGGGGVLQGYDRKRRRKAQILKTKNRKKYSL
jgi:hypothetical protein